MALVELPLPLPPAPQGCVGMTRQACGARGAQHAEHADDAGAADSPIDLTGDDDAVASAFKDWELIDLTRDDATPAAKEAVPPKRAAGPPPKPVAVDELREERSKIHGFLKARGTALRVERCEPNPHAQPGTPLYKQFVAARARCFDRRVQLVFHGTPAKNIDSICRNGLDPKRRAGQAMGPGGALARR